MFEKGGLPEGLIRVVHGGGAVGDALAKSSVGKVFFTGSVEVGAQGRRGLRRASSRARVLELGGKDPMIVCADADLDNADLRGGLGRLRQRRPDLLGDRARLRRSARSPTASSPGVAAEAEALRVGDPLEWEHRDRADDLRGPVRDRRRADRGRGRLRRDQALRRAGRRPGLSGKFIAPTVLTGVTHEMRIMREEIFGPVLPIVVVDSEQEAIELANDSEFGLGASVWTKDRLRGERIARKLESGMVWINDHSFSHGACQCAWGGVKDSGLGRSHSKFGFYECVNIKMNAWEPGLTRDFWWHPSAARWASGGPRRILYGRDGAGTKACAREPAPCSRWAGAPARRPLQMK